MLLAGEPVMNEIKSLNQRKKADAKNDILCFMCKILHNKLLKVMYELLDIYFDEGRNVCAAVTKYGAKSVAFNQKAFKKLSNIY